MREVTVSYFIHFSLHLTLCLTKENMCKLFKNWKTHNIIDKNVIIMIFTL